MDIGFIYLCKTLNIALIYIWYMYTNPHRDCRGHDILNSNFEWHASKQWCHTEWHHYFWVLRQCRPSLSISQPPHSTPPLAFCPFCPMDETNVNQKPMLICCCVCDWCSGTSGRRPSRWWQSRWPSRRRRAFCAAPPPRLRTSMRRRWTPPSASTNGRWAFRNIWAGLPSDLWC